MKTENDLIWEAYSNSNLELLNEVKYSRVVRILRGHHEYIDTVGMISAENPQAQKTSQEFNDQQTERLKNILDKANHKYLKIGGKYGSNPENSFLIYNITKEELLKLCRQFEQESVVFGEKNEELDSMEFSMIYANGTQEYNPDEVRNKFYKLSDEDQPSGERGEDADFYSELDGVRDVKRVKVKRKDDDGEYIKDENGDFVYDYEKVPRKVRFSIPFYDSDYTDKTTFTNRQGSFKDLSKPHKEEFLKNNEYILREDITDKSRWLARGRNKRFWSYID